MTLQNLSKEGNNQIMFPEWQSPKRLIIVNSADHNRIILSKDSRNKERVIVAGREVAVLLNLLQHQKVG
jgi:hypothetical protein